MKTNNYVKEIFAILYFISFFIIRKISANVQKDTLIINSVKSCASERILIHYISGGQKKCKKARNTNFNYSIFKT